GAQTRGRAAGLVAAIALAAMPRFFFNAHLACFDAPIVALWTLCAYTFWRAVCTPPEGAGGARAAAGEGSGDARVRSARAWRTGLLWPVLAGLTFGLALDTKHNSWFLPIVAVAHTAGTWLVARFLGADARRAASAQLRRAAVALAAMAVIGPLVFVALWPWI